MKWIKNFLLIALTLFMLSTTALGASACHRFKHNDHDVLLIGEVIETNEIEMVILPSYFIVSAGELNDPPRRQLQPDVARVMHNNQNPNFFQTGDYVIASLDQNGAVFEVTWGIYRVDSLDWQTLTVSAGSASERFTTFVNSSENKVTPIFVALEEVVVEEATVKRAVLLILLSVGAVVTIVIGVFVFKKIKCKNKY